MLVASVEPNATFTTKSKAFRNTDQQHAQQARPIVEEHRTILQ